MASAEGEGGGTPIPGVWGCRMASAEVKGDTPRHNCPPAHLAMSAALPQLTEYNRAVALNQTRGAGDERDPRGGHQ
jgi:hypothetical protein